MKKAVKAGIIGAGALGYSIIPTYLMKYHWIIRDKKMAKKEEKVLYLTFDDGLIPYIRTNYWIFWIRNRFRQPFSW